MNKADLTQHTTVITYGTFDLFHVGHVRLLKRLRTLGDKLIIGCSSDDFNTLKGKKTVMSYEQRKEILLACRYVDYVFKEECWEQKRKDILLYKAKVFAMGDDWTGKFDDLNDIVKVIYLPRTEQISTTELKEAARETCIIKVNKSFMNKFKHPNETCIENGLLTMPNQICNG